MVTLGLGSWEALGNHYERSWSGEGVGGQLVGNPPATPRRERQERERWGGRGQWEPDLWKGKTDMLVF